MFRQLLSLVAILLMNSTLVFPQNDNSVAESHDVLTDTLRPVGIHPWKKVSPVTPERAFWTLYMHGGFNIFDGDFHSEKKHSMYVPTVGIGASYYFNNTWSIGVDYIFREYKVTGTNKQNTAPVMLKGMAHQADAYITFDIFNAWRPQNRYKLFALNLIIGGGVGWFKNSLYYPNEYHTMPDGVTISLPEQWNYHTAQQKSMSNNKYTARSLFLGGASFDFNINRSLALGVRCIYNYYTKDDIDGRVRGNNNDGVFDATIMLRYKINAVKKSHVANFRSTEALDRVVRETNPMYSPRKDTVVVYHHDTVVVVRGDGAVTTNVSSLVENEMYYYVYFDPNEYTLYDDALQTIQQVAGKLQRDNNLYAEITGYCDNTGSDLYNQSLGRKRAQSVAEEFEEEYGIDSVRIKIQARGIIRGRRSTAAYSPNRRVEIKLMHKDEFERQYGSKPADNQIVPAPKKVVLEKNATLTKLARKYYGNVNCWIFIFEANLDVLATPNSLHPGMEIVIPTLNDSQILIKKDEALRRYETYKIK